MAGHGGGGGGGHGGGGWGGGGWGGRGGWGGWGGGWGLPYGSVYDSIDPEDFGVVGMVVPDGLVADYADNGSMVVDAAPPVLVVGGRRRRTYGLLG